MRLASLELFVPAVGGFNAWGGVFGTSPFEAPPANGSTSFAVTLPYFLSADASDPTPAAGDNLYFLQYTRSAGPGYALYAARKFLVSPAPTFARGSTVTIAGAFADGRPAGQLRLRLERTALEAQLSELNAPTAPELAGSSLGVHTYPSGVPANLSSATADLLVLEPDPAVPGDLDLGVVPIATPFPASWEIALLADAHAHRLLSTGPRAADRVLMRQGIEVRGPLAAFEGRPIGPVVGPVRNVRVDGQPALVDQADVRTRPLLEWDPPSVGVSDRTRVTIFELTPGASKPRRVAQLDLAARELKVPPGLLVVGKSYVIELRSSRVEPDGRTGDAITVTGVFRPIEVTPDPADAGVTVRSGDGGTGPLMLDAGIDTPEISPVLALRFDGVEHRLGLLDPSTGDFTERGPLAGVSRISRQNITVDATGSVLYYVDETTVPTLASVDLRTLVARASIILSEPVYGLSADGPGSTLYALHADGSAFGVIDPANGRFSALTPLMGLGALGDSGFAFDPRSQQYFLLDGNTPPSLLTLDVRNGMLLSRVSVPELIGLRVGPRDGLLYALQVGGPVPELGFVDPLSGAFQTLALVNATTPEGGFSIDPLAHVYSLLDSARLPPTILTLDLRDGREIFRARAAFDVFGLQPYLR